MIELVQAPSAANLTQLEIPYQSFLADKKVFGLETYCSGDLTLSPTGNAIITPAILQNAYLNLYFKAAANRSEGFFVQNLPLISLHRMHSLTTTSYVLDQFLIDGPVVYWEKSFIKLGAPMANGANISFMLNVSYQDPNN